MLLSQIQRTILMETLLLTTLTCGVAACRIDRHTSGNGKDNVSIQTPLGGMNVKTDRPGVLAKVGLPAYPGAIEDKRKNDDSGSADVNMSFGDFRLRVLAVGYTTPDTPDKVRDFYRHALAQYGDVIECRHEQAVGARTRTGQGLTCSHDSQVHAEIDDNHGSASKEDETELKAGSPSRQHIVSFEPRNDGTHFGLVSLELPHALGNL